MPGLRALDRELAVEWDRGKVRDAGAESVQEPVVDVMPGREGSEQCNP